jgi:hypothetical protein
VTFGVWESYSLLCCVVKCPSFLLKIKKRSSLFWLENTNSNVSVSIIELYFREYMVVKINCVQRFNPKNAYL